MYGYFKFGGDLKNTAMLIIFVHMSAKTAINDVTREDKGDREGIPHTHPIP